MGGGGRREGRRGWEMEGGEKGVGDGGRGEGGWRWREGRRGGRWREEGGGGRWREGRMGWEMEDVYVRVTDQTDLKQLI